MSSVKTLATCATLSLLVLQGCSQVAPHSAADSTADIARFESDPQLLGNGTVRTYIDLDEQSQPQTVGVIISAAALTGLPSAETEVLLTLPPQATVTALNHIALDWRPHGHDPGPIYGFSHFDVHAYLIAPEEREAITAAGDDLAKAYQPPAPDLLPAGYVMAPDSAEPRMGSHWVDPTSDEFQGDPHGFSHALIYGFYNGNMAFIEPMVSLDFLSSYEEFEGEFAVPQRYPSDGLYPTQYRITYSADTQEHVIALTGFIQPE